MLSTPVDINVQSFVYHAFSDNTDNENQFYLGKFSATEQQLLLSLSEPEEGEVLFLELTKKEQGFNAQVSTELAMLSQFLLIHQTMLSADFLTLLADHKNDSYLVSGHLESQITWDDKSLNIANQLSDFSFQVAQVTGENSTVNIDAFFSLAN